MKKRIIALLLVLMMLVPAGIASAAGWYRVNTSSLKVHYMAGENSKVLASYRRDYALKILSTDDGWSYVQFSNGFKGYVQTKYLTKGSSYSAWIASDNTNLRKGPDGGFSATALLAKGRKVTVLSHGAKYDYVYAGSMGYGYVVNSLLSKKRVKPSGNASESTTMKDGDYTAWILSTGKVNLRKSPSSTATIVAKYKPATEVYVIKNDSKWAKVKIGSSTGWMMTKYLTTSAPAETVAPTEKPSSGSYTAYVVSSNKKPVNVRKGNSNNYAVVFKVNYGQAVTVLKHNTKWDYIQHGNRKGYIQNSFLQLNKPKGTDSTLAPQTTPKPFKEHSATIWAANGKSVNFHKGMGDSYSNIGPGRLKVGTEVTVLKIVGRWAQIEYSGYVGWVHKEFLK